MVGNIKKFLKNKNMKQLLFLLLFPCLAIAQYPGNGNQKITLGEQTTADGLVYRGLAADTTRKPSVDTMAYILLDTNTNIIWQYKKAVDNAWTRVGGSISSGVTGVLPVANGGTGSATQNFVDLTTTQSIGGAKTFTSAVTATRFNPTANTATGTGMYAPSSTSLGFSTNGTNRLTIASTGALTVNTTATTSLSLQSTNTASSLQLKNTGGNGSDWILQSEASVVPSQSSLRFYSLTASAYRMSLDGLGRLGVGEINPSAFLHLKAGTATASTAPLKFTSGTNLASPLGGEMEFNGTNLFFSPSTTRHTVNHGLVFTATLNFASTNAQSSNDQTIAATGAALGDVVSLGVPNAAVNANTSYSAWVSAANTVTVRFNNYSSGTVDPASALFKVFVTK
jgi:hypothetical protein